MEQFLDIAEKHEIGVMFVLFESVWDPYPKPGNQREPYPHRHNSGWVQSPGQDILKDPSKQETLRAYVQDVIDHFRHDRRVQIWDLFNKPDNLVPQYRDVLLPNKAEYALRLLKKTYAWAREVNPSQPLTSGVWIGNWGEESKLSPTERSQLAESDVITFHSYDPIEGAQNCVQNLKRYHRPILCTEFMARPRGSRFDPLLGYFSSKTSALTAGASRMAKRRQFIRGIPGKRNTPVNRTCGFMTFSEAMAPLTMQPSWPISNH